MITLEDYINGAKPDYSDRSREALFARGEFLVKYVDPHALITYEDILDGIEEGIDKGVRRVVIPFSPSAGKTTAVRQLISSNSSTTGVYACKLIEDIDKIEYDVIATCRFKKISPPKIVKFTSETNPTSQEIGTADWVLCTHARLMIEPSSVLTMYTTYDHFLSPKFPRNYFIVDEYPSNVYYYTTVKSVRPVDSFNDSLEVKYDNMKRDVGIISNSNRVTEEQAYKIARDLMRRKAVISSFDEDATVREREKVKLLDHLHTPVASDNVDSLSRLNPNEKSYPFKLERLVFFMGHFVNKYQEKMDYAKDISDNDKLYYSLSDLAEEVPLTVLDGTGDLILGKFPNWYIPDRTSKTTRYMNVSKMSLIESYTKRNNPVESIVKDYVEILTEISTENPDEKILAYMWKFSKDVSSMEGDDQIDDNESLPMKDMIERELVNKGINNVSIITYMSGEEKGTSQYSDRSVAVILGEFFVPSYVIHDINKSLYNRGEISYMTSEDYTLSLLIQFLYRTRARRRDIPDNSIKIYMDHRYSKLAKRLFEEINISGISIDSIDNSSPNSVIQYRKTKLNEMVHSGNAVYDEVTKLYYATTDMLVSEFNLRRGRKNLIIKALEDRKITSHVVVPKVGLGNGTGGGGTTVYVLSSSPSNLRGIAVDKSYIASIIN